MTHNKLNLLRALAGASLPFVLAAVLLAGLLWRVHPGDIADEIGKANLYWVPALLAANLLSDIFRTLRWQQLLSPLKRPPFVLLFMAAHIGSAVNLLIPLRAGEAVRFRIVSARTNIHPASLVGSLVGEVLSDLATFSLYIGLGLLLLGDARFLWPLGVIAIAVTIVSLIGGYVLAGRAQTWQGPPEGSGLRVWAGRQLYNFGRGLESLRETGTFGWVLLACQGIWLSEALMFYLSGQSLGVDLSFPAFLLIVVTANIAGSVPFTQSGFGVFELGVTGLMLALGVSDAQAAAYAIFVHILLTAPHLVYGPLAALVVGLNASDLPFLREAEETAGAATH